MLNESNEQNNNLVTEEMDHIAMMNSIELDRNQSTTGEHIQIKHKKPSDISTQMDPTAVFNSLQDASIIVNH